MTTKQKYEAKLARLENRYAEIKEEMIKAYDEKKVELGHELNDKLLNMLDVIELTENILENLK